MHNTDFGEIFKDTALLKQVYRILKSNKTLEKSDQAKIGGDIGHSNEIGYASDLSERLSELGLGEDIY